MRQYTLFQLAMAGMAALLLGSGAASAQQGPAEQSCEAELTKHCADKPHQRGEARACLEANRDKLSEACRHALDTTGPGKGVSRVGRRSASRPAMNMTNAGTKIARSARSPRLIVISAPFPFNGTEDTGIRTSGGF